MTSPLLYIQGLPKFHFVRIIIIRVCVGSVDPKEDLLGKEFISPLLVVGAILLLSNKFVPNLLYSQNTRETGSCGIRLKPIWSYKPIKNPSQSHSSSGRRGIAQHSKLHKNLPGNCC